MTRSKQKLFPDQEDHSGPGDLEGKTRNCEDHTGDTEAINDSFDKHVCFQCGTIQEEENTD